MLFIRYCSRQIIVIRMEQCFGIISTYLKYCTLIVNLYHPDLILYLQGQVLQF